MDEATFWELVGAPGRDPGDATFERLTDMLSDHGAGDITGFADHLAVALHALDTPAHHVVAAGSDDDFLAARCAAVAAGRTAYEQALAAPELLDKYGDGTALLTVAPRAFRISTGRPWDHTPPVSHDAGANTDAWGERWLCPSTGSVTPHGHPPLAYLAAVRHVMAVLDADRGWRRWWRAAGVPRCELTVFADGYLDHLGPSADIQGSTDRIRATFTCAVPAGHDLLTPATAEVVGMLGVIRAALALPALPAVGDMPAHLPADDEHVTPLAPPELLRLGGQQGYITLTQIQEFYDDQPTSTV
jgi:hypothetical protein